MLYKKLNIDRPSSSKMATKPESLMDFDFKTIVNELPKKQRVPLSVAQVQMKNHKERDQKMLKKNLAVSRLGRHVNMASSSSASTSEKRKRTNERNLKCLAGYFMNGVLSVNHLLKQQHQKTPSRDSHGENHMSFSGKGKKKMAGKKNKGMKGKGKGRC